MDHALEFKLRQCLEAAFQPEYLVIDNQSASHAGHHENTNAHGETHFTVTMASSHFRGKTRLQQHRMVFAAVKDLMAPGLIHALALNTTAASSI